MKRWLVSGVLTFSVLLSMAQSRENDRQTEMSFGRIIPGEELRRNQPLNLWQAIKISDPSLIEGSENEYGSDPNNVPGSIGIRGTNRWQSHEWTTPVLPIFVIDGAIVNVRRVYDFNINDVESVIIHKDAASLATWGLRGGNGVVEIRSVRPKIGPVRFRYSFDGSIQAADLSSYNLLDARQKLRLEKEAGLYRTEDATAQVELSRLLAERESAVNAGTNTDWLREPLTVPFQHRHTIDVEGGDEFIKYKVTLRAAPGTQGVMKGSKRDLYEVDTYMEYRYRSLVLSNNLSAGKVYSEASTYGDFSYFSSINPYFTGKDEQGLYNRMLGEESFNQQANPVYEATLSSFRKQQTFNLYNNLTARLALNDRISVQGNFAFLRDNAREDFFTSPDSYVYSGLTGESVVYSGEYGIKRNNQTTYEGNLSVAYHNQQGRSTYGAAIATHVFQGKYDQDRYAGIGIPSDNMGFISFTTLYDPSQKPFAREYYDRMLSGSLSAYYAYDSRYLAGASLRADKSAQLAPDKKSALFYGAYAQWNIHNEKWFPANNIVNRLALRGELGTAGGSNFEADSHSATYYYNIGNEYIHNYYLIGTSITNMVNPALKPYTSHNKNISLEPEGKLGMIRVNYYNNLTDNLLIEAPAALATGFRSVAANGGSIRNSGVEFTVAVNLLNDKSGVSLSLFTNGIHNRNRIASVPAYFQDIYNREVKSGFSVLLANGIRPSLIEEGKPVNTIYAVNSGGLGYSDGMEMFFKPDGSVTQKWLAEDMVAMGSTDPKMRGNFGFNLSYKGWSLNSTFTYATGAKIYNPTLDAIQNSPVEYNMDRRALDIIKVKATNTNPVYATSRFVENLNRLDLGAVQLRYHFDAALISRWRMEELDIFMTGNNLFSYTSSDFQRGTLYPFARTWTLSLRVTF